MQEGQVISLSPSFSDDKLAGIAARVVDESDSDKFHSVDADDFDFEFAFVTTCGSSEPSSADEIFQNGKIRPVYPIFDRVKNVIHDHNEEIENGDDQNSSISDRPRIRHPLSSLFIEEKTEMTTTSASTEVLWKKSTSAGGGSKRWTLKNLMHRSRSYGSKDSSAVVFTDRKDHEKNAKQTPLDGGKVKPAPPPPLPSNRDGSEKLRSYLPYRLDLVGFFGNVNVLRKT